MVINVAAAAMLALWAVGTFLFDAPGVIHILLTGGVALWIWNTVRPKPPAARP